MRNLNLKIQNPLDYPGQAKSKIQNFLISLGLFLLALFPRAYDLPRFVTADEAKWVYRSAQFLAAFLQGDWAATSVNLTPAVTTTWLGSLGLASYYRLHQTAIGQPLTDWLLSLPEFRTELAVLVATRWPMTLFTALAVVAIYWLTQRLFNPDLALPAAVLIALDPHPIALSRVLGHDAPAAVFVTLSLLLLLLGLNTAALDITGDRGQNHGAGSRSLVPGLTILLLSGLAAGLAFLSKAPALFLIPFTGLVLAVESWRRRESLYRWLRNWAIWGIAAYLTFIIVWPAAWVEPAGRPLAVFENAFLSATDQEEADDEGYWQVPDLGPFYYIVNGGFKLSSLVLAGAGAVVIFAVNDYRRSPAAKTRKREDHEITEGQEKLQLSDDQPPNLPISHPPTLTLLWLFLFVLLFTLFLTFSDKRSPRYILPAFPVLSIIAAYGWLRLYQVARLQGSRSAGEQGSGDEDVKRRRGEAAKQVVEDSRSQIHSSLITHHSSRLTPHVSLVTPHASRLIFHLLLTLSALIILLPYIPYYFTYYNPLLGGSYTAPHLVKIGWGEGLDQVGRFLQREFPGSRVGAAYASTVAPYFGGDLSIVEGDRLDYVVLYRKQVQSGNPSPAFIGYFEQIGPIFSVNLNGINYAAVYPGPALQPPAAEFEGELKPLGFRPSTPYGRIGETLAVDVLWAKAIALPAAPPPLALQFASSAVELDQALVPDPIRAGAEGYFQLAGVGILGRYQFTLPAELPQGSYQLVLEGASLGELDLRRFEVPANLTQTEAVFADQIALRGYQFELTEDYIGVTVAWQARQARLPDYTVFAQLLNAETNERLAGVDTPPLKGRWPASRWAKGEVVVDKYLIAVPPELPPDFFKIIVGLYQPETGTRLLLADGQDHWELPWTLIREE